MTRIKVCGIKDTAHALAAVGAGADFIGLVFAASRRRLTPAQAAGIAGAVKKSAAAEVVGVFVNMPAAEVNQAAISCHLDWVQLSGDEPWEYCLDIDRPIIKAVRIGSQQSYQEIHARLAEGARKLSGRRFIYLLDSLVEGEYGGTGRAFDWSLARQAAEEFPVIIAGGLTPENVARAIKVVTPWGVDVSSGVETGGTKDLSKIKAFVKHAREAER